MELFKAIKGGLGGAANLCLLIFGDELAGKSSGGDCSERHGNMIPQTFCSIKCRTECHKIAMCLVKTSIRSSKQLRPLLEAMLFQLWRVDTNVAATGTASPNVSVKLKFSVSKF
ncbi:hypothetical protein L1887_59996 [Cichorium endivia]|nr:hypothetical protein L1887_59996 [Cichorium endivia]